MRGYAHLEYRLHGLLDTQCDGYLETPKLPLKHQRYVDPNPANTSKPQHHRQEIGITPRSAEFQMHFDAAERTPQKGGEMGCILETNTAMNRAMEGMGGEIKRRYRVYERTLS